jgi:hypothetical protein
MGHFTLKPKEREELEAILAVNRQPFIFNSAKSFANGANGRGSW